MKTYVILIILLTQVILSSEILSLDFRIWGSDNSPMPSVWRSYNIAIDSSGKIWITREDSCLYITDTYTWQHYSHYQLGLEKLSGLYDIVVDKDDNKYIGSYGNLFVFDKNNNWKKFDSTNSPLKTNILPHLVDNQNNLWIKFLKGLAIFDGLNWTIYDSTNCGLPDFGIRSISQDVDGSIWLTSQTAITRFDGTDWQIKFREYKEPFDSTVKEICISHDGTKYFVTWRGLLMVLKDDKFSYFGPRISTYDTTGITTIVEDKKNNIIVGSRYGLYRFEDSTFSYMFGETNINNLIVDKYNNKWFSSYFYDPEVKLIVYNEDGLQGINGINEENIISRSITLYPNPASDFIEIENLNNEFLQNVTINDLLGNVLFKDNFNDTSNNKLDISKLPIGVYFLNIKSGTKNTTRKFIIQR